MGRTNNRTVQPVLKNTLLILISVLLCTAAAEGMVRWLDAEAPSDALKHLGEIPLAEGVQRAWFGENPPPLPNRRAVSPEAAELVLRVEASGVTKGWVHALCIALVVARVVHPFGINPASAKELARGIGAGLTFLVILAASLTLLWKTVA